MILKDRLIHSLKKNKIKPFVTAWPTIGMILSFEALLWHDFGTLQMAADMIFLLEGGSSTLNIGVICTRELQTANCHSLTRNISMFSTFSKHIIVELGEHLPQVTRGDKNIDGSTN